MPSFDLTSAVLLSSRMMSMHNSTHSSQMNTVGPAINLRTSCWLLPQNEQYSVFLASPSALAISFLLPAEPVVCDSGGKSTVEPRYYALRKGSLTPSRPPRSAFITCSPCRPGGMVKNSVNPQT